MPMTARVKLFPNVVAPTSKHGLPRSRAAAEEAKQATRGEGKVHPLVYTCAPPCALGCALATSDGIDRMFIDIDGENIS